MNTEGNLNPPQISSAVPPTVSQPVVKSPQTKNGGMIVMIVVVIVILAILGLNVFGYLAKGTSLVTLLIDKISNIIQQILQIFGMGTMAVGKGVDKTINLTKIGMDKIVKTEDKPVLQIEKDLDKTLNEQKPPVIEKSPQVIPNSSDAIKIQSGNKKGWCYVGSDRDYRSCLKVNEEDVCMSGEVFLTKQRCEHPELRYDN